MSELLDILTQAESLLKKAKEIAEKEEATPTPTPSPSGLPDRTGSPSWTGSGKFNTYYSAASASPSKKVRVRAWFYAKAWSGGGSEQPQGFCLANKGVVGSHWGFNLTVRPNGIVANGTKGEVVGACTVTLNAWHYIDATIEKKKVTCQLDGKTVTFPAPSINLLQSSSEPLRIGGYKCPWEAATWFNQGINGTISDWSVEIQ